MKRALAVGLLLSIALCPAAVNPDFQERLLRFHQHYNQFVRIYLGCPKGAVEMAQCHPDQGTLDYAEFLKARTEARKLFDLSQEK